MRPRLVVSAALVGLSVLISGCGQPEVWQSQARSTPLADQQPSAMATAEQTAPPTSLPPSAPVLTAPTELPTPAGTTGTPGFPPGGALFTVFCQDCLSSTGLTKGVLPLSGRSKASETQGTLGMLMPVAGIIQAGWLKLTPGLPPGSSFKTQIYLDGKVVAEPTTDYGGAGGGFGGASIRIPAGGRLAWGYVYQGPLPTLPIDVTFTMQYVPR